MNAVNQLQTDAQGYMDRVTNGDVLDYDMLQLEVGDAKESRKSRLASTLVLGAEYGFFNNKLAVGVLSTTYRINILCKLPSEKLVQCST